MSIFFSFSIMGSWVWSCFFFFFFQIKLEENPTNGNWFRSTPFWKWYFLGMYAYIFSWNIYEFVSVLAYWGLGLIVRMAAVIGLQTKPFSLFYFCCIFVNVNEGQKRQFPLDICCLWNYHNAHNANFEFRKLIFTKMKYIRKSIFMF